MGPREIDTNSGKPGSKRCSHSFAKPSRAYQARAAAASLVRRIGVICSSTSPIVPDAGEPATQPALGVSVPGALCGYSSTPPWVGQNAADLGFRAVGRIRDCSSPVQVAQDPPGVLQLGDSVLDLPQVLGEQFSDMTAGRLSGVTQSKNIADFIQEQACGRGLADEGEPVADLRRIVAVSRLGARGSVQQPGLLIEADCLRRGPRRSRQLSNAHASEFRLDLPLDWKVYGWVRC
jgi:hypothetical protein